MNKAFLSGVAAVAALGISTASAVELDGKKGIGAATAIGGTSGLAFNYGTGNLAIEGILSVDNFVPGKDADGVNTINLGVGAHFMALRADKAAFSVGGRLNLGMGKTKPDDNEKPPAKAEDVTQFGLDIPLRVYWFADEHVSFHYETGISVAMAGDKGGFLPTKAVGAESRDINIFGIQSGVGATFWW
jgi:hypothetical protein